MNFEQEAYVFMNSKERFLATAERAAVDRPAVWMSAPVGAELDAIIIANDFGTQRGLLLSRQMIHDFVMPGAKKIIDQAHSYGVKVIYHSCGAVFDAIPELIEVGADLVHPIQAAAVGMEPERLKAAYGDQAAFCGGVDIQHLLPCGTPEQVREKVPELRALFPTGLVISPSQGVILDDVPPENVKAMVDEAIHM